MLDKENNLRKHNFIWSKFKKIDIKDGDFGDAFDSLIKRLSGILRYSTVYYNLSNQLYFNQQF
jgi:hypothetical protein